ncbi:MULTISPECIES: J domain-containing protein [Flammeovirga]|uniref:J domain-containing protein n=1 Tax=Flammeovirga agarivorans TaxID=2726742 RepID=A0A7X8SHF1_9BACT|nr:MULTISPECIES: J domain-containing protein [Flammeovirga]NLR90279.1 J domain-containing protein [Flammeovirga agarivorans]
MLVDRFKNILKATINDQIESNPVFQNLFQDDDGFKKEWQKYYDEIIKENKSTNTDYQDYSYQDTYQQQYQAPKSEPTVEEKHYNALEVKPGDDFATIKKSYRRLVKVYHPDLYTSDPKKQEMAQKVTLEINEAYNYFEKKYKK